MAATSGQGHPLPYDTYREAVARETLRFAAAVEDADLASAVPACPGWTLADLTRHVGSLQRWFAALLTQRVQEPPRSRDVELGLPEDEREWPGWVAAGEQAVAAVLRDTDPEAPMWVWGADRRAGFWARRMLFETLVHRVDAEQAVGGRAGAEADIEPALAADGVDEFLVNLPYAGLFAPGVTKLRGDGETLAFVSTDTGEEWRVRLDPDGFRPVPREDAEATAVVRAPAAGLLLLLYGRRSYQEPGYDVSGPTAVLDNWFAHTAF
ncbi:maleylpyruvate isomerase N-terminal domain-containing protein [Streptomyces sp. NPDC048665]|uniref:maleylpyruvate isomerase N-terminal domain-containing protein n=1 Tax=unclassified Streptomyces TaxID=2593676 RepID=UPI001DD2D66C|nr:maleylpyruvate isomerase N-terminal domain-containing protein [Streptomyces sp. tea 10]